MADLNYAAPMSSLVARTDLWQPITACKNPGDFMLTFHE